jgi:hypothetical protein
MRLDPTKAKILRNALNAQNKNEYTFVDNVLGGEIKLRIRYSLRRKVELFVSIEVLSSHYFTEDPTNRRNILSQSKNLRDRYVRDIANMVIRKDCKIIGLEPDIVREIFIKNTKKLI